MTEKMTKNVRIVLVIAALVIIGLALIVIDANLAHPANTAPSNNVQPDTSGGAALSRAAASGPHVSLSMNQNSGQGMAPSPSITGWILIAIAIIGGGYYWFGQNRQTGKPSTH